MTRRGTSHPLAPGTDQAALMSHERTDARSAGKQGLCQDGPLRFQKFLNVFYGITGIGDADGVGLAEFVMDQQFANHSHLQIPFRHAPELTSSQRGLNNAERSFVFLHGRSCALTFD
jgi:hypothetical protein